MKSTQLPGAYPTEHIELEPEIIRGYNTAGDIIREQMLTAAGAKWERDIFDSSVSDQTVVRTVTYTRWRKI